MSTRSEQPVLILGGGINGCAVARELAVNGVPVCLVEKNDLAYGATSKSSRLIHGGLRYLEYGDFGLVRESLLERQRWLDLAPHFVETLRLYIPVENRFGGFWNSVLRFMGGLRIWPFRRLIVWWGRPAPRGLWLARIGLWLYDFLAGTRNIEKHSVHSVGEEGTPPVDHRRYRWLCAYKDCQILHPERFIVSQLTDARSAASEQNVTFDVWNWHTARPADGEYEIINANGEVVKTITPSLVINATGAWGDQTLANINVKSERLFGGTRGSHLVTCHTGLREALRTGGIYAESRDGRMVFLLPFGEATLIGTTDIRFEGDPGEAIATEEEILYLINMVNDVMPAIELRREDVDMHYSGVRPLPHAPPGSTAAISRDHEIVETRDSQSDCPLLTLIGGKLTTCGEFGAEVADRVFARLGIQRTNSLQERPYPGFAPPESVAGRQTDYSDNCDVSIELVRAMWQLCGSETESIIAGFSDEDCEPVPGTRLPLGFVRWVLEHEWVEHLEDLVLRRLMLVFDHKLTHETLEKLTDLMAAQHDWSADRQAEEISNTLTTLGRLYGKTL